MKRWLLLISGILLSACTSQPTPVPPVAPSPNPLAVTEIPIATLLPTVIVTPPVTPSDTPPAAPQVSSTKPTARTVAKFPAPVAVAPVATDHFNNGNDIKFVYESVGQLAPDQCYLIHAELVNPNVNPGNRGDDFLDTDSCGDPGPAGKRLNFVLYRGKFTNSPNYGTILAQALAPSPDVPQMKMTWTVRVVQNRGRSGDGVHYTTTALSPNSPRVEFDFTP